jgi:transposase
MGAPSRQPYPSDVSDAELARRAAVLDPAARGCPQRRHDLREVFNALRWLVRTGAQWAYLPHEFPAWPVVYQQARRWICSMAIAFVSLAGGTRWTSSGAVQLSQVKPSWASHWDAQPATIGWPTEWREGW